MKKTKASDQKDGDIAAIEAALAETHADIAAGRVVKESAEAHVKRLRKLKPSIESKRCRSLHPRISRADTKIN